MRIIASWIRISFRPRWLHWLVAAALLAPSCDAQRLFGQTVAEYAARRAAVRAAAKGAIVLLCGPADSSDVSRTRFRTDNDILYLTGVEAPGACLALLPDDDPSGKREILFLPRLNPRNTRWVDPVPVPGEKTEQSTGIQSVQDVATLWTVLKSSIQKADVIRLPGVVGQSFAYFPDGEGVNAADRFLPNAVAVEEIRKINPAIAISGDAERLIHPLRWRKSAGEVANLRAAIAATGEAERAAAKAIGEGVAELSAEGVIVAAFRRGGAVREGFPSIVGSGPNSTILHHFSGDRKMRSGELVVVDIGAEYNYYSADITRTFPVNGKFTPRQRELYRLVLDTQAACARHVKPGITTIGELHGFAVSLLRNSPLRGRDSRGGFVTMDRFFVHGLGHSLGMDVHDVFGDTDVLQPGTVFTIEPGVYIQAEGIGIRIEDDYLVTETGVEKLSTGIPSDPVEIEAMMRKPATSPNRAPTPKARKGPTARSLGSCDAFTHAPTYG